MDAFLEKFRSNKTTITICVSSGEYVSGTITGFDDSTIWLDDKWWELIVVNRKMILYLYPKRKK